MKHWNNEEFVGTAEIKEHFMMNESNFSVIF